MDGIGQLNADKGQPRIYPSGENYLKCILLLQIGKSTIIAIDVAQKMRVSKASVSHAVKRLRKDGFLVVGEDRALHRTDKCHAIADRIYKRLFFAEWLIAVGTDPKTAEQEACMIEHIISQDTFEKIRDSHVKGTGYSVSEIFSPVFPILNKQVCRVTLLRENPLMHSIIDRFGESLHTRIVDENHFSVETAVNLSSDFYGWIFISAGKIKIMAPQEAVDGFRSILESFAEE